MKFAQYLLEAEDDLDEVKKLLNKHCSQSDFAFPIYRGMRETNQYIVSPHKRKSISPASFHNLYLDQNIKKMGSDFPQRNKCIIGITHSDDGSALKYANKFGDDTYALFPMDDAIIGVCDNYDILKTIFIDAPSFDLKVLNNIRRNYINAYFGYEYSNDTLPNYKSTKEFIDDFYNMITEKKFADEFYFNMFYKVFNGMTKEEMNNHFLELLTPNNMRIKFVSPKELSKYQMKEVWFDEKCIAIDLKLYRKLIKDGFTIGE